MFSVQYGGGRRRQENGDGVDAPRPARRSAIGEGIGCRTAGIDEAGNDHMNVEKSSTLRHSPRVPTMFRPAREARPFRMLKIGNL